MDTILAKTFLEVVACDSFAKAAERLFVSQSAVSLRIRSLEEQLGRRVFIRSKVGITLTPAGYRFQRYAFSLLQVWEEAKQQVAVPDGYRDILVLAGEYSLWNRLLIRWLPTLAGEMPEIAFRAEVARHDRITIQMLEGTVDIAVLYTPQIRRGINAAFLCDDPLVMVSTFSHCKGIDGDYVFVDWGAEFTAFHGTRFPDYQHSRMTFRLGPVTLNYLLNNGGSAYMPRRLVEPLVGVGKLHLVPEMPPFSLPVHVVWREKVKPELVEEALSHLRKTVELSQANELPAPFWAED